MHISYKATYIYIYSKRSPEEIAKITKEISSGERFGYIYVSGFI